MASALQCDSCLCPSLSLFLIHSYLLVVITMWLTAQLISVGDAVYEAPSNLKRWSQAYQRFTLQ